MPRTITSLLLVLCLFVGRADATSFGYQVLGFGGTAAALFPADIANLEARWRADLGITKDGGDNVSQWDDQSGNGRTLTEATNQPLFVDGLVNGHPAIRFDGTNDLLSFTTSFLNQPVHIFIIVNQVSFVNNTWITNGTSQMGIIQSTPSPEIEQNGGSAQVHAVSLAIGTFGLIGSYFDGASSEQFLNDGAAVSGSNPGTTNPVGFRLAVRNDGSGNFSNIEIAEVAVYSVQITGNDLTRLKAYFSSRYGVF